MSLEAILLAHRASDPREEQDRQRMLAFARCHPNPFDRTIPEGHFTGSGLVMSRDGDCVLLLYHLKLHRWLQPGGHGQPGETSGETVASREVAEETGLAPELHPRAPQPFDVDIHSIPARNTDPSHDHLDLRYLFVADPDAPLLEEAPEETGAGTHVPRPRWFDADEALAMDIDPGLKRMIRKARVLLAPLTPERGENPP